MKTLIKILKILIAVLGATLMILYFVPGNGFIKIQSYIATILLPFAIDVIRMTGVKVSKQFELSYLLFLIPAMIMGIDFDLYTVLYPLDKIVHGLSGLLVAFGAKEIIDQASGKPDKKWFKVLFMIAFVALVAVLWECFEFTYDEICGGKMQELITPGVEDTMYDMIVAMVGGVIGTIIIYGWKKK